MPKIPRTTGQLVQTDIANQPKLTNQDVSSGSRALAKGISDIGVAAKAIKLKRDTAEAESLLFDFENNKNDILFNPKSGYYNSQGQAAVDGHAPTQKALDDLRKQYQEKITNPAMGDLFNKAANARMGADQKSMAAHASKGQRVWEIENFDKSIATDTKTATFNWNSPDVVHERVLSTGIDGRDKSLKQFGDNKIAHAASQDAQSSLVTSVIKEALNHDDGLEKAEVYREKYKDILSSDDLISIDKSLNAKQKSNEVARLTDEIWNPLSDQDEIDAKVAKIKNPEIKLEVIGNLYTLGVQRQKTVERNQAKLVDDSLVKIVNENVNVRDIDPEIREAIGQDGIDILLKRQKERDTGKYQTTDWSVYQDLKSNTEWLDGPLPLAEMGQLATTEFNDIKNMWDAYQDPTSRQNKARFDDEFGITKNQMIKTAVEDTIGPKPATKKSKAKKALYNEKYNWMSNEINRLVTEKQESLPEKRKLNSGEYKEILDKFKGEIAISGGIYNWIGDISGIDDIPETAWNTIMDQLELEGKRASTPNILEAYKFGVENGDFD